jgi:uncharacterized delta-60 repeat protein
MHRTRSALVLAGLLAAAVASGGPAWAAAGDLDPTFGSGGKVVYSIDGYELGDSVEVQSDGKIVLGGFDDVASGDFALVRLDTTGALDPTFGSGGYVITDFQNGQSDDSLHGMTLQADGKIVAVGFSDRHSGEDFAVARYLPDGSLDTSFGAAGTGLVRTDFGGADAAFSVAVQPNGRILVAGLGSAAGLGADFALARYRPNGRPDRSFGVNGKVLTDLGGGDVVNALLVEPDGKIVAVGAGSGEFGVARYLPDGALDTSFGPAGTGFIITSFTGGAHATDAVLQPDGKIVAFGDAGPPFSDAFALARYTPAGRLDRTFGPDGTGKVTTSFVGYDLAGGMVLQPDGALVVDGTAADAHTSSFGLARYDTNGILDPTFGPDGTGIVVTDFVGGGDASDLALQSDGKVVALGSTGLAFAVARYLGA